MGRRVQTATSLDFVWLEITGKCQLTCEHCYATAGPRGTHGAMSCEDWCRVVGEAADLGVGMVQFIGGEPTSHPDLARLIGYARSCGLRVELFSNLLYIRAELWEIFSQHGVSLATSYYSDDPIEHENITKGSQSHRRTSANIAEAVNRGIPLRVGLIGVREGQRIAQARAQLALLGVTKVGYDDLRQVGRGVRDRQPDESQLCGRCGQGVLAISPDGVVWPCVFSRWLSVGYVREQSLLEIMKGSAIARARLDLQEAFSRGKGHDAPGLSCKPWCMPTGQCAPTSNCPPVGRCIPMGNCLPLGKCMPRKCIPGR
jgi:MoaA/NifB/PqqE/SkfB family radical SAM enzyme